VHLKLLSKKSPLRRGRNAFGKVYFHKLLEQVRSLSASERRIWQQISDIYAECSFDYDVNSEVTKEFLRHGAK
jgi:hypothetical protein